MTTRYDLTYRQTPSERYRSGMNEEVAELADCYPGVRLVSTSGGSMLEQRDRGDTMIADNTLTVEGSLSNVRGLATAIERHLGRSVEIEVLT